MPPCITDIALTNILWLKKPLRMPDLPIKRVIADTYAAIHPSDDLWHSFLKEIDKLRELGEISQDDALLLRHSIECKQILMDKTLGDEHALTQATLKEMLTLIHDSITRDLREELEIVKAEKTEIESDRQRVQRILQEKSNRIKNKGTIIGCIISRAFAFIFFGIFVTGAILTMTTLPAQLWMRITAASVQIVVFFLSALNLFFGTTVRTIVRRVETNVEKAVIRLLE